MLDTIMELIQPVINVVTGLIGGEVSITDIIADLVEMITGFIGGGAA